MQIVHWRRYEIENYLLNPEIMKRFLDRPTNLFDMDSLSDDRKAVDDVFAANFPAQIDWLSDAQVLTDLKASDFLVQALSRTTRPLAKSDLYMLAGKSLESEIHRDVREMLDRVSAILPQVVPVEAVNASPDDDNGVTETVEPDTTASGD